MSPYLSSVRLRRNAALHSLAKVLAPDDSNDRAVVSHKLLWSLFGALGSEHKRDFLNQQFTGKINKCNFLSCYFINSNGKKAVGKQFGCCGIPVYIRKEVGCAASEKKLITEKLFFPIKNRLSGKIYFHVKDLSFKTSIFHYFVSMKQMISILNPRHSH